jgi:hypothetical protein
MSDLRTVDCSRIVLCQILSPCDITFVTLLNGGIVLTLGSHRQQEAVFPRSLSMQQVLPRSLCIRKLLTLKRAGTSAPHICAHLHRISMQHGGSSGSRLDLSFCRGIRTIRTAMEAVWHTGCWKNPPLAVCLLTSTHSEQVVLLYDCLKK